MKIWLKSSVLNDRKGAKVTRIMLLFFSAVISLVIFSYCGAQSNVPANSIAPIPYVPLPPQEYQYPSLICGLQFPEQSAGKLNEIEDLYKRCVAVRCYDDAESKNPLRKNITKVVLTEPREFLQLHYDGDGGYTIFCAFFADKSDADKLAYVNCGYINNVDRLAVMEASDQGQYLCEEKSRIFGPNVAAFSMEERRMPVVSEEYTDVQATRFYRGGRRYHFILGPAKTRYKREHKCDSQTPSHVLTPSVVLPSTATEGETVTEMLDPTLSQSVSDSVTPKVTDSESIPPTQTIEVPPTPTLVPHKCWHYSTGVYNDSTDQPDRYVINNAENTVIDTFTCLMWQRNISTTLMNWTTAKDYCENLVLGGYDDWTLPREIMWLQSLVDYTKPEDKPGINEEIFPDTPSHWFWTLLTHVAYNNEYTWVVNFGRSGSVYMGKIDNYGKENGYYVRCVRAIINISMSDRFDNTSIAEIVKDRFTGIWWERSGNVCDTWYNAKDICKNITIAGFNDWQLPSIKAFVSIMDITKYKFTINKVFLYEVTCEGKYWSSTARWESGYGAAAFRVNFLWGGIVISSRNSESLIRYCRHP